jgi:hypothetical protein
VFSLALELIDLREGAVMDNNASDQKEMMYLAGGLALVIFGTGVIMSNPAVRRFLLGGIGATLAQQNGSLPAGVKAMLPDIERYLKMSAM